MNVIAALSLGLMGSIHCLGMCGPIVIAIPFSTTVSKRISGVLLYNLGRVITYSIIGAVFGLFGKGLVLAGFQQVVSIVLGSLMILVAIFPVMFKRISFLEKIFYPVNEFIKNKMAVLINGNSYGNLLITGIFNGLLPCGLVYLAVFGAIASGSVTNGVLFMTFFGLGTIPMMALIPMLGSLSGFKFRTFYKKILPYVVICLGVLFILRGMNLGIKYISPKLNGMQGMEHHSCH